MTKDQILADLDYASTIAKGGANTPLLGGRIGLMWGILLTLVFFGMWLILSDKINMPESYIGFMWLTFAVIGGAGSAIMGQQIDNKVGANSVANRVETYVWIMFSALMGTLFTGVVLNMFLNGGTAQLFDFIVIAGFAGQGLAYGVVAKLTGHKWIHLASLSGFIASTVAFVAYGQPHIYLIGSIGAILTIVVPSLISLKREV